MLRTTESPIPSDSEVRGGPDELPVEAGQRIEQPAEDLQGLLAVHLREEPAVAGRDPHGLADRPASLGNDGVHRDVALQ